MVLVPRRASKVNKSDVGHGGNERAAAWWRPREEHILRLQVRMRQLDAVHMREGSEAICRDVRDLWQRQVTTCSATAACGGLLLRPRRLQGRVQRRAHLLEREAVVSVRLERAQQPHDRERALGGERALQRSYDVAFDLGLSSVPARTACRWSREGAISYLHSTVLADAIATSRERALGGLAPEKLRRLSHAAGNASSAARCRAGGALFDGPDDFDCHRKVL